MKNIITTAFIRDEWNLIKFLNDDTKPKGVEKNRNENYEYSNSVKAT
jgi:hypothetical protein